VELLDSARLDRALAMLSWQLVGGELVKVVRREDFAGAIAFVNEVARLAEGLGHHPDLDLRWNTVTLRLRTHSLGGISDADVELAALIDQIR
jgi:4a-hydroxytetrahydrobiopterin dehydratase